MLIHIRHDDLFRLGKYAIHLKNLSQEDKMSRFGHAINDYAIDQLALQMIYHHKDHELWSAVDEDANILGWGHMAKAGNDSWELAVSVEQKYQRKGVGNELIRNMLEWSKFHHIPEVFMHCIEDNKVIQHLALKNELKTRERGYGERTAAIQVPEPTLFESNAQLFKEQAEIMQEIADARLRLANLWLNPTHRID